MLGAFLVKETKKDSIAAHLCGYRVLHTSECKGYIYFKYVISSKHIQPPNFRVGVFKPPKLPGA